MNGQAIVVQGDARHLPLPDDSVDLIITSPPYFALRSYTDEGAHYDGQIGSEGTWQEWIERMVEVTAEWARVLKPSGSMFVDLGDKYAGSRMDGSSGKAAFPPPGDGSAARTRYPAMADEQWSGQREHGGIPAKSLMLLPERYRIACVDQLGLIARAVIVHSKPNSLPESVTDRVRRSHEDWVHLTLKPRYYSAVDEIRTPYAAGSRERIAQGFKNNARIETGNMRGSARGLLDGEDGVYEPNALGALPGSVWSIPTEPLKVPDHLGVDHFAAFPSEWPRRLILGWSPPGVCVECGEGRRPVVDKEHEWLATRSEQANAERAMVQATDAEAKELGARGPRWSTSARTAREQATITGYACSCPTPDAPTRPAVILDPFGGTGTTAMVARALGRVGISVDLSHDYSRLARWRIWESGHGAKAEARMWADRQGVML